VQKTQGGKRGSVPFECVMVRGRQKVAKEGVTFPEGKEGEALQMGQKNQAKKEGVGEEREAAITVRGSLVPR